ncbi:MAG: hypothetical protein LBS62_01200 [Clostridiales bacterium]|nr:hypothetical protein [Clostridiales bacterium]
MKFVLITAGLSLSLAGCSINAEPYEVTKNGLTCVINPTTGMITQIRNEGQTLELDGVLIDVGYKGEYQFTQMGYFDIGALETWALPKVYPRKKPLPEFKVVNIRETDSGLDVELNRGELSILYHYSFEPDGLRVSCELRAQDSGEINGVAFITRGMALDKQVWYEFPGNTPAGARNFDGYINYQAVSSDYCASSTVFGGSAGQPVNVIFIDSEEKWGTGVYKDEKDRVCVAHVAGVLSNINPGEAVAVGELFIQLVGERRQYAAVREYYESLGYAAPPNAVNSGPIYSAHPSGTMDTGFTHRRTLNEFAEYLPTLKAMGIASVWLLPVFTHPGAEVYSAVDQAVIDPRYGGESGAVFYIDKAHALGMKVLFDYVPHGPAPKEPLAVNNPDWISKTREGGNQIEWDCVSFDYNNAEYAAYTTELVRRHAEGLGVDGARIDCSMGGLPNWAARYPARASSSGLAAGVNIVRAIREGFEQEAGKPPIILPENFHPIPIYAEYTDIFYDMPLYRVMNDLNYRLNSGLITETEYVETLQHWLWAEKETSVKGLAKLRFLGNHDTVSWTFDAARPQAVYGTDKAKALWALMSFIDGVPMIYQGDENPRAYGLRGADLTEFFTELFAAREKFIPPDADIEYIDLGKPVFAFRRFKENRTADKSLDKLVLINFSPEPQTVETDGTILFSPNLAEGRAAAAEGGILTLEGFGFAIVQ